MVELGLRFTIVALIGEMLIPIAEARCALRFLRSANAFTSYTFELLASNFIVASRSIADLVTLSNRNCLVLDMSIVLILAIGLLELLPEELVSSKFVA